MFFSGYEEAKSDLLKRNKFSCMKHLLMIEEGCWILSNVYLVIFVSSVLTRSRWREFKHISSPHWNFSSSEENIMIMSKRISDLKLPRKRKPFNNFITPTSWHFGRNYDLSSEVCAGSPRVWEIRMSWRFIWYFIATRRCSRFFYELNSCVPDLLWC